MGLPNENCCLCYRGVFSKTSKVGGLEKKNEEKLVINQFLKLVERYLETSFTFRANYLKDLDWKVCKTCRLEVDSFCKLYADWKRLELGVEWRLRKICDIINNADRRESEDEQNEEENVNLKNGDEDERLVELWKRFRTEFKHKCSLGFSKAFPKVVVERLLCLQIKHEPDKSFDNDTKQENSIYQTENLSTALFLGWISSLLVVIFLGICVQEGSGAANKTCQGPILKEDLENDQEFRPKSVVKLPVTFELGLDYSPLLHQKREGLKISSSRSRKNIKFNYTSPFKCFCCNRNFNNFFHLQRHRRAFTHILTKTKKKLKIRQVQRGKEEYNVQITNIGFLQPLQGTGKRTVVEDDVDCTRFSGAESVNASSSFDRDTSSSSSSSLSDIEKESKYSCPFCEKQYKTHNYSKSHAQKCHLNPTNSSPATTLDHCERGTYKCNIMSCLKRFNFREELENHTKLHGKFPCSLCNLVKEYAPDLVVHESDHMRKVKREAHGGNMGGSYFYKCARCSYKTAAKFLIISHYLKIHLKLPIQRMKCHICRFWYAGKTALNIHMKMSHPKEISKLKCHQCSAAFQRRSQLSKHARQAHSTRKNLKSCDATKACPKKFENEADLKNHRQLHGKFSCSICPVIENYAPNLALHELTHYDKPHSSSKIPTYNCSRCTFVCKGRFQYVTHFLETHLNLPSESVSCQNCGEKFPSNGAINKHVKLTHSMEGMEGKSVAKCDKCQAYFRNQIRLFSHKKKMHGEDASTCVDCGRKYANSSALRTHRIVKHKKKEANCSFGCDVPSCKRRFERKAEMDFHKNHAHNFKCNGENECESLICKECGKKCSTKTALKSHLQRHDFSKKKKKTEAKKFICEKCGMVFKSRIALGIHELSHGGPASWKYSCIFCGKKCAIEQGLQNHLKAHIKERCYICEVCGVEFAYWKDLRNHKNKRHGTIERPKPRTVVNRKVSKRGQKLSPRLWV